MAILVKKKSFWGEFDRIVVSLWVGAEGLSVTVTTEDEFGFSADDLPIDDAITVGRKVRALKQWAEQTPEGRAKVQRLFEKEANALSRIGAAGEEKGK